MTADDKAPGLDPSGEPAIGWHRERARFRYWDGTAWTARASATDLRAYRAGRGTIPGIDNQAPIYGRPPGLLSLGGRGLGPIALAAVAGLAILLVVGVVWVVRVILSDDRPVSSVEPQVRAALAPWGEYITAVEEVTRHKAAVVTTLSSTSELDLGVALGMCEQIRVTRLDPVMSVGIETAGGTELTYCSPASG